MPADEDITVLADVSGLLRGLRALRWLVRCSGRGDVRVHRPCQPWRWPQSACLASPHLLLLLATPVLFPLLLCLPVFLSYLLAELTSRLLLDVALTRTSVTRTAAATLKRVLDD